MDWAEAWLPRERLNLALQRIGRERQPVLIVEGAVRDAHALVDFAANAPDFRPAYGPAGGYPGHRAAAPVGYVRGIVAALLPALARGFNLGSVTAVDAECSLSLVTLPPAGLVPAQRAPHVDTTDPMQFALLHYLCDARFGGTGFFRHRRTGFESVTPDRNGAYQAARVGEPVAEGYIVDDDPAFERTAMFAPAFDRLIAYRSNLLHSGLVVPDALDSDPRKGRLTANIFLTLKPA